MRLFGARRTGRRDGARRKKYKVEITFPYGATEELDEVFDTEEEAAAYGLEACNNYRAGGKVLRLSAGLDEEDVDGDDDCDFEVIEVDA